MLLQQIVATLDGELERLSSLREIVSSLAGPSVLELESQTRAHNKEDLPSVEERVLPKQPRPKRVRQPKSNEPKPAIRQVRHQPEPRALTAAIPVAPVVVTAAALAKEGARLQKRAEAKQEEAPSAIGTLGSMIRALRLDSNS